MHKGFSLLFFSFGFTLVLSAQGKIGSILHNVKDNTQTVKSTVDLVKPEETKKEKQDNQQQTQTSTTTQTDTVPKTNSDPAPTNTNGTTNNLAIGDQGTNNNQEQKDNNGSGGKKNQVKNFVKGSKANGTGNGEKPYSNGTTPASNLAIGDQGTVEDKTDNSNNKKNNSTENNAPQNSNGNSISPK